MEHKACKVVINRNLEEKIPLVPVKKFIKDLETIKCRNTSDSIKFLNSKSFNERLKNLSDVFLVKFQLVDNFKDLSENDLKELSEKFKDKSIVIFLASNVIPKFSIHWKSNKHDNFLTLKPYTDIWSKDDEQIYDIATEMIVSSLWNGHLGE